MTNSLLTHPLLRRPWQEPLSESRSWFLPSRFPLRFSSDPSFCSASGKLPGPWPFPCLGWLLGFCFSCVPASFSPAEHPDRTRTASGIALLPETCWVLLRAGSSMGDLQGQAHIYHTRRGHGSPGRVQLLAKGSCCCTQCDTSHSLCHTWGCSSISGLSSAGTGSREGAKSKQGAGERPSEPPLPWDLFGVAAPEKALTRGDRRSAAPIRGPKHPNSCWGAQVPPSAPPRSYTQQ